MSVGVPSVPFFAGPAGRLGALESWSSAGADLVFTRGMTGHDPLTGRVVTGLQGVPDALRGKVSSGMVIADVPEARIRAQTLVALEHARRALEAAGSGFGHLVTLRLFLRDIRDAGSAAGAVQALLGADAPATTIIEATGPGVAPDVDIVVDAVGARRGGRFVPRQVTVPGLERLTGGFPAATVLGPYVFTTPVSAADPATGRLDLRREALTAEELEFLDPAYFNLREETLAVEQVLMWRNIRRILDATGVPFENILHQNNWLTVSMQHYVPVTRVRGRLFGRADARTAATSLPISALRTPGAAFECSVTGVARGHEAAGFRKEIRLDSHGVGPYYVGAVKAGPCIFAAGEVPVRTATGMPPDLIGSVPALGDDLRQWNVGRVHAEMPLMAQAQCVYELIDEALARYGSTMRDVLHQAVYLVEPAQFPLIERVATLHYGVRLPPTTLVPIRGASPFAATLLEIEVTAHARDN